MDSEQAPERMYPEVSPPSAPLSSAPDSAEAPSSTSSGKGVGSAVRAAFAKIAWLPLITVVIPTLTSIAYYGVYASDVFISESHFIVRSAQRQTTTGLTALLTTGSISRSQDDTYTVHDFMRSRDAMAIVDRTSPLRELFGDRSIDAVARFDGFRLDRSEEGLFKFFQKAIVVDFDTTTGISTLRVHAFKPADSQKINASLLEMSEGLVNELNERARRDMIRFATSEVELAEQKARAAASALSVYRNENAVFDPERQSALQLAGMSKLQDELIATTIQVTQVRMLTPDNPQLPSLEKRLVSIHGAIQGEMAKVAGGQASLSRKAVDYERLSMDRAFAEKQLATALVALEQARSDAQRKQLYLERIVQPNLPDIGLEPRRIRSVFATLLVGLLTWGILSMLVAGVREHRD